MIFNQPYKRVRALLYFCWLKPIVTRIVSATIILLVSMPVFLPGNNPALAETADKNKVRKAEYLAGPDYVPELRFQPKISLSYIGTVKKAHRYKLQTLNPEVYKPELFKPASYLPPCGQMANSSRTWVFVRDQKDIIQKTFCLIRQSGELSTLWFDLDEEETLPESIKLDIWDRQTDRHFISESQRLPAPKPNLPGS